MRACNNTRLRLSLSFPGRWRPRQGGGRRKRERERSWFFAASSPALESFFPGVGGGGRPKKNGGENGKFWGRGGGGRRRHRLCRRTKVAPARLRHAFQQEEAGGAIPPSISFSLGRGIIPLPRAGSPFHPRPSLFSSLSAAAAAAAAEERRKEKLDESFLNNFLIPFSGKFLPPFPLLPRIGREGRKTFGDSNQEGKKEGGLCESWWMGLSTLASLPFPCPFSLLCDEEEGRREKREEVKKLCFCPPPPPSPDRHNCILHIKRAAFSLPPVGTLLQLKWLGGREEGRKEGGEGILKAVMADYLPGWKRRQRQCVQIWGGKKS